METEKLLIKETLHIIGSEYSHFFLQFYAS